MDEPNPFQKLVTLLLMALAVAAAAYGTVQYLPWLLRLAVSYTTDRTFLIGWISGYFLAAALAVWIVFWVVGATVQLRTRVWGAMWFLPLLIVAVVVANAAVVYGPRFLTHTSEQAEMDRLMDQAQHQIAADIKGFQTDLKALGYPNFLQPYSFGAPRGLDRSLAKIKQARAIVAEYSGHRAKLLGDIRMRIKALNISEVNKIEALTKLDAQFKRSEEDRARIWQLQDKVMGEYQAMLEDVAKARGHWSFDGYNVNFARPQDQEIFDAHLKKAATLADETRLLGLKLMKQSQDNL